jgi:hypothetical protein
VNSADSGLSGQEEPIQEEQIQEELIQEEQGQDDPTVLKGPEELACPGDDDQFFSDHLKPLLSTIK